MDKRVNDIRLEQWKQIINEQLASGMTIRGWCKQNDIKQRQFHYWKKKLIDHNLDDIPYGSSSEKSLPSTQVPRPARQSLPLFSLLTAKLLNTGASIGREPIPAPEIIITGIAISFPVSQQRMKHGPLSMRACSFTRFMRIMRTSANITESTGVIS